VFEHFLAVAEKMLGIDDRQIDAVFSEQVRQRLLAVNLGEFAEIATTPQEIEGVIKQFVLSARGQLSLEFREFVRPSLMITTSPSMMA
jgi:hypothetical protein